MSAAPRSGKERILDLCQTALGRIDEALTGTASTTLSQAELRNIQEEIIQMASTLDLQTYQPSYARFITDSYQGGDDLSNFLLDVSYQYNQRLR